MFLLPLSGTITARKSIQRFASAATFVLAVSLPVPCLHAQSNSREKESVPTFRADVQNVVVDVVVTDHAGNPRTGLHREDFALHEQGKPQQINSFEEHTGDLTAAQGLSHRGPLPLTIFSNEPPVPVTDTLNVLLLDSLNTDLKDQQYVHAQAMKYLKNLPPGTRMAIFTLSTQLRFVLSFTTDATKLSDALNQNHGNAVPDSSPLLQTSGENAAQQDQVAQMASVSVRDPAVKASMQALQKFQQENSNSQGLVRITDTVDALADLARYLATIPGRKNVIWFAGTFPAAIGQSGDQDLDVSERIKRATNALAAARVALYPVRAGGVVVDSLFDAETRMAGVSTPQDARLFQQSALRSDSIARAAFSAQAMELAGATGGEAIFGTNNLAQAMGMVVNKGTHYYTLTYSPIDRRVDGRYRPIRVELLHGTGHLEYRRGYYADTPKTIEKAAKDRQTRDPLARIMGPRMPDVSQIVFKVRVLPLATAASLAKTSAAVGATPSAAEEHLTDSVRYGADLAISMGDLRLTALADGKHEGSLEWMLVAFDSNGKALNYAVKNNDLSLDNAHYLAFLQAGLQLHEEIDLPRGTTSLRIGVFDPESNRAGTLNIPITQIIAQAAAAKRDTSSNF